MRAKKERHISVAFTNEYSNYPTGRQYVFKDTLGAKIGDAVLVDTKYGVTLGLVKAVDIKPDTSMIIRETVEIIKSKYFEKIVATERMKVLKKEMKKKLDEATELEYLRSVAKTNSELAEMLSEYEALEKIAKDNGGE